MSIFNMFCKEKVNVNPNPNGSRDISRSASGISFVDVNHIIYVENIMRKKREHEGRDLKFYQSPEDKSREWDRCFECDELVEKYMGDIVPIEQIAEDDFKESFVCYSCIDEDEMRD